MSRIYVGNLDPRATERELEDEFRQFGVLRRYTFFFFGVFVICPARNIFNAFMLWLWKKSSVPKEASSGSPVKSCLIHNCHVLSDRPSPSLKLWFDCIADVGNFGVTLYRDQRQHLKTTLKNDFTRWRHFTCSVWVARKPPGFAFIEFEDRRDAEDAIRELNGEWFVSLVLFPLCCADHYTYPSNSM